MSTESKARRRTPLARATGPTFLHSNPSRRREYGRKVQPGDGSDRAEDGDSLQLRHQLQRQRSGADARSSHAEPTQATTCDYANWRTATPFERADSHRERPLDVWLETNTSTRAATGALATICATTTQSSTYTEITNLVHSSTYAVAAWYERVINGTASLYLAVGHQLE